ncbi:glycoside hydrolase family 2 TIM barrel-domain containing protein [Haloplasma contractile]|uniref:PKD domain containing protein n=1 Tax=Haloplasma contractile SSD-17B TaxID=1033810 RepID=U2FI08_9MOLU|nr:glycoside hydrolase family 2 TIM barrel-domain containing protein [Haloplasma contractile]ERJ12450.1 PKD domain containing protein [Haloplasma contractile SSD-17B]
MEAKTKPFNGVVEIKKEGNQFNLYRNNKPYYINGIGGFNNLDIAEEYGANSFRTWNSKHAGQVLDSASHHNMTVMLGITMSKKDEDYHDDNYKKQKRLEIQELLDQYKNHSSLLVWAIGNEINLGTNSAEAWTFVEDLASIIKEHDQNHPVCTVIAGANSDVINNITKYAPTINVIGINSYAGALHKVKEDCLKTNFEGPYIITEWGPVGHWEVDKTRWNAPIEQTSLEKAESYKKGFQYIKKHDDLFLGSYVFLWGQKEERTPTWYGLFVETNEDLDLKGEICPTVDVMCYSWTGSWPKNQAPIITNFTLNSKYAIDDICVNKGETFTGKVTAADPDCDELTYTWEILKEATKLGIGGSFEPRPAQITKNIKSSQNEFSYTINEEGAYRLYVYVLDGNNHVATANIPFLVK